MIHNKIYSYETNNIYRKHTIHINMGVYINSTVRKINSKLGTFINIALRLFK